MKARDMLRAGNPLRDHVAAVSCGMYNGVAVLDLDYAEDSEADTDANFVMTGAGNIVEVQGTAEKARSARSSCVAARARAQGHRQAGRAAEARRDVSMHRHRSPARLVIATHNRASLPKCASCWACHGVEAVSAAN